MKTRSIMKKAIVILLAVAAVTCLGIQSVSAASYDTNYKNYTTPSSSDYAYWNGSKVVKASGTTTSEIKWMQAALNYCIKNKGLSASYLDVDGSFGPASQKTTKAFQKKYGLDQDGSFGPGTISKMKTVLAQPTPTPTPKATPKPTPTPTPKATASATSVPSSSDYAYWNGSKMVKASGTTTAEIKWMQESLNWCISKGLKATKLTVDGSFGPASDAATRAFQESEGLTVDGSFGSSTIAAMKKVLGTDWKPKEVVAKYNLIWPTNVKTVSGKYGKNGSLRSGGTRYHSGIDIDASVGSPCYAVADGVVVMCKNTDDPTGTIGGRGRYIVIYHSNGNYSSLYEHLNSCSVTKGATVKAGQKIGTTGNSGWQSSGDHYGAHLHFGLMTGKMTDTGYDLWYVGSSTKTFDPDPAYNKSIKYTYK